MRTIKCVVAGVNAQGEADFWFVKVCCTEEQFDLGKHYDGAQAFAEDNDFEAKLTYDEVEAPAEFMNLFEWKSASVVDVEGTLLP
jgi:hypothetical protein